MTDQVNVATDDLRQHCQAVTGFGDRIRYAADAAQHLSILDDGYGALATPLVAILHVVQAAHAQGLAGMASALDATVDKVTTCADAYDQLDNRRAGELSEAAGEI
ncbi:type VII secretion target [Nocardia sp. NPDC058176]|uniref:type VII secretion target n=1 Tax=Nocardia sp. NPDC058176 TaxID=3346368 RepID=UPI0036D9DB3A